MNKAQVMATEKGRPKIAKESVLYSNVQLGTHTTNLLYVFSDNKLIAVVYQVTGQHSSFALYEEDFDDIDMNLTVKYGSRTENNDTWHDERYKGNYKEYGWAVAKGDLEHKRVWVKERTIIEHQMSGDNHQVTHAIIYRDKNAKPRTKTLNESLEDF